MKKYLLRISGLAALILLIHSNGSAQQAGTIAQNDDQEMSRDTIKKYDEIIIKRKNDKDTKVTIEIKDGQVFVNGKPLSEYNDDNLSIRRRKVMDGDAFSIFEEGGPYAPNIAIAPGAPRSPFRSRGGAWNLEGQNARSNRSFLGVTSEKTMEAGAKVREVSKGSAAEKAGLKAGDLITRVDEIEISNPGDLTEAIHKYKPADKVVLTYKRDGKEQKATATLGEAKHVMAYNYNFDNIMPRLNDMDFNFAPHDGPNIFWGDSRPRLGIKAQDTEDGKGVKVLEVNDDSPADKAGIKEGDIITRFDDKPVESAVGLAQLARESRTKASVKVNLLRGGKPMEIEIKTPKKLRTADL